MLSKEKTIIFIPVDYDYFDWQGKNYVKIIGRTEKGKKACVIDSYKPYFWVISKSGISKDKIEKTRKKIEEIKVETSYRTTKVVKTELHNKKFLGEDVKAIKIFITNYKDAHAIADQMGFPEIIKRREYDINFITRYIIEKKVKPLCWYEITGEELNNSEEFGGADKEIDVEVCLKANKIFPLTKKLPDFSPKILAYDIETDDYRVGQGEILMISLVGKNLKRVLTCKKPKGVILPDFVEYYKDEAEMLEAFVKHVKKQDPDILAGYFSDVFDLPYLRARAEKFGVRLSLGIDDSQPRFTRGILPSGRIFGIVHTDLYKFVRTNYSQYLQSETLSLNEVASELLGEKKTGFEIKHSSTLDKQQWLDYFQYNLQDSVLAYKLAEKFWYDMNEFTKIVQEPLYNVSREAMSGHVENYILHNLFRFDEIGEKRPTYDEIRDRKALGKYVGAFVFQPTPSLYNNIVIFDFTSMYASVIVTFNLSKSTFLGDFEKLDATKVVLGNNKPVYFTKKAGFFPVMLSELIKKRRKYKEEYKKDKNPIKKARSNAYKLLANASYGYQGFFGARYYCREAAASTAALAKKSILETIKKIQKAGYKVIYSDTDSIAFLQENKTKTEIKNLLVDINKFLPGVMELDLEGFFKRGIWVSKRTAKEGAKKKYALLDEKGSVKIRGFETVRRDWCQLAKEVQKNVLLKILREGNPDSAKDYVQKIVYKIKKRQIPNEKLIIKTQLKRLIENYTAISPHVTVAKKMIEAGMPVSIGSIIEYIVKEPKSTGIKKGKAKKLVRERAELPGDVRQGNYDVDYYINHQVLPAIENIFEVFQIHEGELKHKEQKFLKDF